VIKKIALAAAAFAMGSSPVAAATYDFNFTFTNPGAVMEADGLGEGVRTFSGIFSHDDATGVTSFVSGTYGNANGSMALGSANVSNIFGVFNGGGSPTLNVVLFDWESTLAGAEYADDAYSFSNGRLLWDNGTGSGQFEPVSGAKTTFREPVAAPEINGSTFALVGFILFAFLFEVGVRSPGLRLRTDRRAVLGAA